ncbi:LysR family transcriptional regulator [Tumebacillus sp. ITR2]|uniref:LysR family transcriptional regulator n=1 Tax=Tumebacillus amylolyticus TaxID=2801339 RepID=A0ABS1J6W5_9BACL|nr:LysR family transcriptional regulator [Tumebacillus amylolyticus]MBL0386004.1 LysR family transcriptional regulator [Tumebacillus amylolyticus]
MELDQIRAFLAIAQTKSFTRAAEQLHVAQSTITTRIKLLEETIGKPLFTRDSRRVELTPAGLTLQPYLQRALDLLREGELSTYLQGKFDERFTVGALSSIWQFTLYPLLFEFRRRHPEVALRTITGHSDDIARRMFDGLIDLGLVYLPPHHPEIEVQPLYRDSIVLVGPPDFDPGVDVIPPEILPDLPFLFMNWGSPFSEWYDSEVGTGFLHGFQVDDTQLLVHAIRAGEGIGFLLQHIADDLEAQGIVKKLPFRPRQPIPTRNAYLIYPKRKAKSPVLQAWIELFQDQRHQLPQIKGD